MRLLAQANTTINLLDPSSPYNQIQSLKPSDLVSKSIELLLGTSGVIAFIYLLMGGIQWITSGGDKEGLDKAKKKITHALVGLAVVFSVYAMVFIIRALFNINTIGVNINQI